jgi:hypothetical protein
MTEAEIREKEKFEEIMLYIKAETMSQRRQSVLEMKKA